MSIFEYNQKEEEELIRREEKEIGKEIGIRIGEERERKNTERERRNTERERRRADAESARADAESVRADGRKCSGRYC